MVSNKEKLIACKYAHKILIEGPLIIARKTEIINVSIKSKQLNRETMRDK